jgi:hypothetical protein
VGSGGNFLGQTVTAIGELTSAPRDIATHQGPAGRARALSRNTAQLPCRLRKRVEISHSPDKGSEAGSRAGKTSSGGEVVLGDNAEGQSRKLGEGSIAILEGLAEGAKVGETGEGTLGGLNLLGLAIEVQGILSGVIGRARSGSQGAKRALGESDGKRGVGGEVESNITLAPVSIFIRIS